VKKKLVLSVLSTAVVASMASAAMAQVPGPGILVGGEVNKYYSLDAFLDDKYFDQALNEILDNQEDSYLVVDKNGNVAPLSQALFAKNKAELDAATRPASKADFNGKTFKYADSDDEWNSATDPDLPDDVEVPGELKVESVSAINGAELQIKFGVPVVKADVVDSTTGALKGVTISPVGTAAPVSNLTAELSKDGKILTVKADVANNQFFKGVYNVFIDNSATSAIRTEADYSKKIEKYEQNITVTDTTKPTIAEATYVPAAGGKYDVTVKFSEPLNTVGTVSVNGKALNPQPSFTKGSKEVKLAGLDAAAQYEIAITGAKDAAGNYINPNPATTIVKVTEDTVKPVATLTAEGVKVTVKFSEVVDLTGVAVKVNGNTATNTLQPVDGDDTAYTLDLTPELGSSSFLNATVEISGYKDLAGNTGDKVSKTFTISADKTAPKLLNASLNQANKDTFVLKFDEVVGHDTLNKVKVRYTGKDGVPVLFNDVAVATTVGYDVNQNGTPDAGEDHYLELKVTQAELLENSALKAGTYQVTIPADKVKDAFNNKAGEVTFTVTVGSGSDAGATLEVVTATETTVPGQFTLTFSDDVDAAALTAANYKLDGVTLPSTTAIDFNGKRDEVIITLPANYVKVSGERELEVVNVKDVDGNTFAKDKNKTTVELTENVLPVAKEIKIVDDKTIQVVFSEELDAATPTKGVKVRVGGAEVQLDPNGAFSVNGDTLTIIAANADTFAINSSIEVEFKGSDLADTNGNVVADGKISK